MRDMSEMVGRCAAADAVSTLLLSLLSPFLHPTCGIMCLIPEALFKHFPSRGGYIPKRLPTQTHPDMPFRMRGFALSLIRVLMDTLERISSRSGEQLVWRLIADLLHIDISALRQQLPSKLSLLEKYEELDATIRDIKSSLRSLDKARIKMTKKKKKSGFAVPQTRSRKMAQISGKMRDLRELVAALENRVPREFIVALQQLIAAFEGRIAAVMLFNWEQ